MFDGESKGSLEVEGEGALEGEGTGDGPEIIS
jgi:hypothetical protein